MRRQRRVTTKWDAIFGTLGIVAIVILFASDNPPQWYMSLFGLICLRDIWQWTQDRLARRTTR